MSSYVIGKKRSMNSDSDWAHDLPGFPQGCIGPRLSILNGESGMHRSECADKRKKLSGMSDMITRHGKLEKIIVSLKRAEFVQAREISRLVTPQKKTSSSSMSATTESVGSTADRVSPDATTFDDFASVWNAMQLQKNNIKSVQESAEVRNQAHILLLSRQR
jgi:hypothetical protein